MRPRRRDRRRSRLARAGREAGYLAEVRVSRAVPWRGPARRRAPSVLSRAVRPTARARRRRAPRRRVETHAAPRPPVPASRDPRSTAPRHLPTAARPSRVLPPRRLPGRRGPRATVRKPVLRRRYAATPRADVPRARCTRRRRAPRKPSRARGRGPCRESQQPQPVLRARRRGATIRSVRHRHRRVPPRARSPRLDSRWLSPRTDRIRET